MKALSWWPTESFDVCIVDDFSVKVENKIIDKKKTFNLFTMLTLEIPQMSWTAPKNNRKQIFLKIFSYLSQQLHDTNR